MRSLWQLVNNKTGDTEPLIDGSKFLVFASGLVASESIHYEIYKRARGCSRGSPRLQVFLLFHRPFSNHWIKTDHPLRYWIGSILGGSFYFVASRYAAAPSAIQCFMDV
jgi:hypothetical protein